VTRRVADLEARLKSLNAERDRLRELYEQANTTEDVLAVQRELADVQREIETTEAQLRTLENQVAYSTVTVDFRERSAPITTPTASTGTTRASLRRSSNLSTAHSLRSGRWSLGRRTRFRISWCSACLRTDCSCWPPGSVVACSRFRSSAMGKQRRLTPTNRVSPEPEDLEK